jgi:parallel beta-helix repeat protein
VAANSTEIQTDPTAFMTYARADNHDRGLTWFREALADAVGDHIGRPFTIFQDEAHIGWGQDWREQTLAALRDATFLIAIVTPRFFASQQCGDELRRFIERERELGRNDLILPVYYIDHTPLNLPDSQEGDDLLAAILRPQLVDWRDLRYESRTSPTVGRRLARMAREVRDALARPVQAPAAEVPSAGDAVASLPRGKSPTPALSASARHRAVTPTGPVSLPPSVTEPTLRTVDPLGGEGAYTTIGEAIGAASAGDHILVRPGVYEESLVVDRPLEIVGQGAPADAVVRSRGTSALRFMTTMGRVSGLKLVHTGDGGSCCVDITQGRLVLEDCDISSERHSGVVIRGGADPRLMRNRIRSGAAGGVLVYDSGEGVLEDNDIAGSALAGVEISMRGNPTLRRNRIHDGRETGVLVRDRGEGLLEDNDIMHNGLAGLEIRAAGNPTVRRNRIHHGREVGVLVHEHGRGVLEGNEIHGNALAGLEVRTGGDPAVRGNQVHGNGHGVLVHDGGRGTIGHNDVRDNRPAPRRP